MGDYDAFAATYDAEFGQRVNDIPSTWKRLRSPSLPCSNWAVGLAGC